MSQRYLLIMYIRANIVQKNNKLFPQTSLLRVLDYIFIILHYVFRRMDGKMLTLQA